MFDSVYRHVSETDSVQRRQNGTGAYHVYQAVSQWSQVYRLTVWQLLDKRFPNRWIDRGDPIPWPAKSLDMTPLDYYI